MKRRRLTDGLSPITCSVECGGQRHRLTWSDGALTAEEHDLDRERVLDALGGEAPLCVEILDAWQFASRHPEPFIGLGDARQVTNGLRSGIAEARARSLRVRSAFATWPPARPSRALTSSAALSAQPAAFTAQPVARARNVFRDVDRAEDVSIARIVLARLPDPIRRRFVLDCVRKASDLSAALHACAWPSLRRLAPWGDLRWAPRPTAAPDGAETEVLNHDGWVSVEIPPSWLRDVWLPVMTRVDGWFVLSLGVEHDRRRSARLLRLRPARGTPQAIIGDAIIARPSGGWLVESVAEQPAREARA